MGQMIILSGIQRFTDYWNQCFLLNLFTKYVDLPLMQPEICKETSN